MCWEAERLNRRDLRRVTVLGGVSSRTLLLFPVDFSREALPTERLARREPRFTESAAVGRGGNENPGLAVISFKEVVEDTLLCEVVEGGNGGTAVVVIVNNDGTGTSSFDSSLGLTVLDIPATARLARRDVFRFLLGL